MRPRLSAGWARAGLFLFLGAACALPLQAAKAKRKKLLPEKLLPGLPKIPTKVFSDGPGKLIPERKITPPAEIPPEFTPPPPDKPWIMRMMIHDIQDGMFIGLPIIDTDPNRGATYGVMPIWVWQGRQDKRIRHIWAPSASYNKTFRWIGTSRYYYYPTEKSSYFTRASVTPEENPDLVGEMEDLDFLGRGLAVNAKLEYDVDGSYRFFGLGPDSAKDAETNYTKKSFGYFCRLGVPVFQNSGWKVNIAHRLAGTRLAAGLIDTLPDIGARFPQHTPSHRHQDSELQLFLDYDTRDSAVTTRTGSYFKFMIENAQREFASEYVFSRYGFDWRHFYKPAESSPYGTAMRLHYEQLIGDAPFYLLPSLGGKTIHRAYGEGRYMDKGMYTATLEERFVVFKVETAGVMTEIELAPFIGMGSVFNTPSKIHRRFVRPVVGGAVRAIARPQVVGSIDVGVGQEGPAVFMDINYSF